MCCPRCFSFCPSKHMLGKYITVYIKENTWQYCLVITPSVSPAHPDLGMSGGSYINLTARMGIPSMAACWWHPDLILHGSWSKKVIDGFYAHLMPVLNRCYTHLGCTCIIIVPVKDVIGLYFSPLWWGSTLLQKDSGL